MLSTVKVPGGELVTSAGRRTRKNLLKTPRLPSYRATPTYQEAPPPPSLIGLEEGAAQCEPIRIPLQGIGHQNGPPGGQREMAWEILLMKIQRKQRSSNPDVQSQGQAETREGQTLQTSTRVVGVLSLWRGGQLSHRKQLTRHAALEAEMVSAITGPPSALLPASGFPRKLDENVVFLFASKSEVDKLFL